MNKNVLNIENIPLQDGNTLKKEQWCGWGRFDQNGRRVRGLLSFEDDFINSTIKACAVEAGKTALDDGDWLPHYQGRCPVPDGTVVKAHLIDSTVRVNARARDVPWNLVDGYLLVEEADVFEQYRGFLKTTYNSLFVKDVMQSIWYFQTEQGNKEYSLYLDLKKKFEGT